jgi:hypothetical protein
MTTNEAINYFGGRKKLAETLGIWPHVIYRWGENPPRLRQFELERITNGELKANG